MDLTTLSGDDTDERVRRLCAKARQPIQRELIQKLGIESLDIKVAAVCVYHTFVETARRAIEGSGIHVAAVSTGFPAGLSPFEERVAEIRRSVEAGGDDGRSGLHQDIHGQGSNERDPASQPGHDARYSRVRAGNRNGRGFQAS